ncbi:VCBS repeat-containing protein [Lacihabitans sp. CS3-21]|uniref:VCBS repeat-containing protein n=1 Tax=Lacihabitans sp. CS3-21 TaxID=2487332 RepID=UPI0020CE4C3C|nr:VCBS repeat-containing protein [Lacihabitans sp. CS3-21]MCP9746565.1 RNA-binding protein [Lacihabitans sp. CS3-21]
MKYLFTLTFFVLLISCKNKNQLFEKLSSGDTNIDFANKITENEIDNVLNYEYFYNGGGVASADFNNDGLQDLYYTANQGTDKIYINIGELKFEDITEKSGIKYNGEWKTGVSVVDINNDGYQDIYVSVSANIDNPELRGNKLYINNKNLTFTDKAAEYGLDLKTYSTQAAFFDYDKDGDLDVYLLNHNVKDFKRFDVQAVHFMRDSLAGDRLMQNNQGKFVDVSIAAGIKGNPIGFGLGIHTADLNNDGWTDIYVSNDYLEEDYLYINNKNGTFTDEIKSKTNHTSYFSMGNEVGDINNDLLPDIITTDMLPEDNKRQKLLFGPEKYEAYLSMLKNGIQPSFMRNMLQLNNGDGTFSEIGQLAGLSNTDWSWSVLFADYDNDGYKDVFVSNGYLRDYTNMDFMKYYADEGQQSGINIMEVIKKMPSTKTPNYIFKNNKNLTFTNKQKDWGFEDAVITNGTISVDLDNDGDLEIVTNNLNEESFVYKNLSTENKLGNYLSVSCSDSRKTGAKFYLYAQNLQQFQEFTPIHGYQSSSHSNLIFGLGDLNKIDSLVIVWPDGKVQKQTNITSNQTLKINYRPNKTSFSIDSEPAYFSEINALNFTHNQMPLNDFSRQILMPQMYSYQGPRITKGDVNGDGLEDVFIGSGKGFSSELFLQLANGSFSKKEQTVFKQDELCTDTDAVFLDIEKDGDLDLIVSSGGYEYLPNDLMLQNRVYINDGKGNFSKSFDALVDTPYADTSIETIDFDKDGDFDLVVGGSVVPWNFPISNPSRLYRNDAGKFTKVDDPIFNNLGIVTDITSTDFNKDGWPDLVIVGEWTGIQILQNNNGIFSLLDNETSKLVGAWSSVKAGDFDKDGDEDLIVGNLGVNSQLKASTTEPVSLFYQDFDDNGKIDPILAYYTQGKNYPAYSRDEISDQIVSLKKKYISHEAYSTATIDEVLAEFKNKDIKKLEITTLESVYLKNDKGTFTIQTLPIQAQFAPIYAIENTDINGDGFLDLILGGNQSKGRVRLGNIDANYVQVFINDKKGNFNYQSSLGVKGDVRGLKMINNQLIVAINNQQAKAFKKNITI